MANPSFAHADPNPCFPEEAYIVPRTGRQQSILARRDTTQGDAEKGSEYYTSVETGTLYSLLVYGSTKDASADLAPRVHEADIDLPPIREAVPNVIDLAHYQFPGNVQVLDITKHLGFLEGNVIKYVARAGRKTEDPLEDLLKAQRYLTELIEMHTPTKED